ncbi:MAG: hypothetical protein H0V53_13615 [Rubrobacter sp.]|nr:hypothetical protein [Rubrobacter sp.]
MPEPDRQERDPRPEGSTDPEPLPAEDQRRVTRAAFRKPINLLVAACGLGVFAFSWELWVLLLTLATYAVLVALASRDPLFQRRVLEGASRPPLPRAGRAQPSENMPPERRARWLPRGKTREKVEAALDVYRKTVAAIESSDDVAQRVLEGAVPRLHETAEGLVDVAHRREEAARASQELRSGLPRDGSTSSRAQETEQNIRETDAEIEAADGEISGMVERLVALRARVVRISIDSGSAARTAADELNKDLDNLNYRLDALKSTMSSTEDRPRG